MRTLDPADPPVPCEPDLDENGVDLAQIREMLDLTPAERLAIASEFMSALVAIRVRNGYPRLVEILRVLTAHRVDFIVVEMAAGVLRGAPLGTLDLDVVHRRGADNVARLLVVLESIEAIYRRDPRRLRPQESHLTSPGHHLLTTKYGDLDCMCTVGDEQTYEDLLDRAPEVELEAGVLVHVIDLPTLIALKEKAGRPKDLAVLPVLRATLAETLRRA